MTINLPIFRSVRLRHKEPKPEGHGVSTDDASPPATKAPSLKDGHNSYAPSTARKWLTIMACVLLFLAFIFLILVGAHLATKERTQLTAFPSGSHCTNERQAGVDVDMVHQNQPLQHSGPVHHTRQRIPAAELDSKIPGAA